MIKKIENMDSTNLLKQSVLQKNDSIYILSQKYEKDLMKYIKENSNKLSEFKILEIFLSLSEALM